MYLFFTFPEMPIKNLKKKKNGYFFVNGLRYTIQIDPHKKYAQTD